MKAFLKRMIFGRDVGPRKVWFGIGAGSKLIIDPNAKSQRILGLDEKEIAGPFADECRRVRTLIDVGASDGYYPILGLWTNRDLTAVGCEPEAALHATALENYKLNFPDAGPKMEWVSQLVGTGEGKIPLDEVRKGRPGPYLIKIDVDGFEVDVLRSASEMLDQDDCRLIVEVHSYDLERDSIAYLESKGYQCRVIKNAWWRLFVPELRPIEVNRWFYAVKKKAA